jgi:hypothetical protein
MTLKGGFIMSEFDEVIDTVTTDGEITTEATEQVETGDTGHVEQTTTENAAQETPQERQERLFRQEEVDRILQTRLAREKQRFESELKNHPTLSYLEQKAQRLGMTVEQLIENDRKYEEQQKINELIQKNIPPEIAQEVYESRKFREVYTTKEKEMQAKQQQQQMYAEFLEAYPEFKDPQKANEIPPEVWQMVEKGEKLLNAYARYENQRLKAEMAKYQQQQQTQQANLNNAATSTGSVRDGGKGGEFISLDEFEANKHDQSWVMKNYSRIQKSRAKW